jgi:NAD(P)H-hydrate epimerase
MKIFKAEQIKIIDQYTIDHEPISSIHLMERAAWQCTTWIMKHFGRSLTMKIFCGCGNNGGDGLAIARQLLSHDYKVATYLINVSDKLSVDAETNFNQLKKFSNVILETISESTNLPNISDEDVVIDAIFGSGLNRPIDGLAAEVVTYLNQSNAKKVSIDIPSGLAGEGVVGNNTVFRADYTLTFQFPFLSFLFAESESYVGQYEVLDIGLHPEIIKNLSSPFQIIASSDVKLKPRPKFGHKGTFGHAMVIAGSKGMAGAAILSSKACLRSGCGLVTVHSSSINVPIIQTSFPEAIVSYDKETNHVSEVPDLRKYNAIAIGPGIGQSAQTANLLKEIIISGIHNLVLDADALNVLAFNKEILNKLPLNTILTPHPGEFDRLFGRCENSKERLDVQLQKSKELGIIIVLKGRYTSIALPNGNCYFNSSGNSGMATAGSGDVLTGIIASLLAQGYSPYDAAVFGVYIHGLAGDIAADKIGGTSLIASDIIDNIHNAYLKLA